MRPTSAAVSVIESTLEKKTVEGFIHEKLTSCLAVVKSFGLVRVGGSENDEGNIIASITRTTTVVIG